MKRLGAVLTCVAPLVLGATADAAGVRDFTRPSRSSTTVSENQASQLTLTLTDASVRPIQNWIRTAGKVDSSGRILTASLRGPEAEIVSVGQRIQAYTVSTRTKMSLGYVTKITKQQDGALVEATLSSPVSNGSRYIMEIVVERGPYLSIPNVSIIEEGAEQVVYVQGQPGQYTPRAIKTGLQGELYTQVTDGLKEGDQVVSVGSFFVDAETKLKSADMMMAAMPGMDHGSMPGMDHGSMPGMAMPSTGQSGQPTVMTDPAPNAHVKAPLMMIHVMFGAPVDLKASAFEVTRSDGTPVDVGAPMPMGTDGKMLMAMPKTPLPRGTYKVKWHTVGADSKKLEGEFSFTVE